MRAPPVELTWASAAIAEEDAMPITHLLNAPWAVLPDRLPFIKDLLMHGGGDHATMRGPARGPQASAAAVRATRAASGAIVVLRLHGVLVPRASDFAEQFGLLGIERFTQDFRAALADDSIGGIVLDVNSPGRRPMNEHEPKPASASHEDVPDWLSPEAQEHWPVIARQLADAGVLTVIEAALRDFWTCWYSSQSPGKL
jgi:hypothetical protein